MVPGLGTLVDPQVCGRWEHKCSEGVADCALDSVDGVEEGEDQRKEPHKQSCTVTATTTVSPQPANASNMFNMLSLSDCRNHASPGITNRNARQGEVM